MAVCEFCGHDDVACSTVDKPTVDYFDSIISRGMDSPSDAGYDEIRLELRKAFMVHQHESAKMVMDAIENQSRSADSLVGALGGIGFQPMNVEWRRSVVKAGLASDSIFIRHETFGLASIWHYECIDLLERHNEPSDRLRRKQESILQQTAF